MTVTRSSPRNSPADDRRARARDAGHQRDALRQAHHQRVAHVEVVLAARGGRAAVGGVHRKAPDDQRDADDPEAAQRSLDHIAQQQADHGDRKRANRHGETEVEIARLAPLRTCEPAGERGDDSPELAPEVDDHRSDRTYLDDRREGGDVGGVDLEPHQLLGDRQMPGARDRQELGDALDRAEDDRFEVRHRRGSVAPLSEIGRVLVAVEFRDVNRLRRTVLILGLASMALLALAPAAMAADGVGLYGRTDDKVVTYFAFGVMIFFAVFVTVASIVQGRLDSRKDRAREELERLRRP